MTMEFNFWPQQDGDWRCSKRQKVEEFQREEEDCGGTELCDLPNSILVLILALVGDVRSRNCASLVCREWLRVERATRRRLCLRGNVSELHMLPGSFHAVQWLDMSNVAPWGGTVFQAPNSAVCGELVAQWLQRAFPGVVDLTVYVRDAIDLHMVGCAWPGLESVLLVRWHQRPMQPEEAAEAGMELKILLNSCPKLSNLDLSRFYCWTEDIAPALEQQPCGSSIRSLNLLKLSPEGFKATELASITSSCRNLEELYAICEFDPRFLDCVNDECLLHCAEQCAGLRTLHLVDSTQYGGQRQAQEAEAAGLDANITVRALESVFRSLTQLQDLALLLGQNVRDSAPAFESLSKTCAAIHSLQLSHFHGLCIGPQLNGIARCSGLKQLFVKHCDDLSDLALCLIAIGCPRIEKLGLRSCGMITRSGVWDCTAILKRSLIHLEIECCPMLSAAQALLALGPVRSTLRHLHIDCVWDHSDDQIGIAVPIAAAPGSSQAVIGDGSWKRLKSLSLWIPAAQVISPLLGLGLECCPVLRDLSIRVEGDCRLFAKPRAREFGLASFSRFECLSSLKLDLSEAVGYALSAPGGNRDLSIWERFYLQGIAGLRELQELDYYPPSDKDVNYRGMTLPGVGLISQCLGLRKLFIHGTAYEHLFMMLLKIFRLRDCQLRADYFPTPEMGSGTEMRAESCRRFENSLQRRGFPD